MGIEDAFAEGIGVDAGEGVGGAGVAADGEETGVLEAELEDVEEVATSLLAFEVCLGGKGTHPAMVYSSVTARLYQLSGMRS